MLIYLIWNRNKLCLIFIYFDFEIEIFMYNDVF